MKEKANTGHLIFKAALAAVCDKFDFQEKIQIQVFPG